MLMEAREPNGKGVGQGHRPQRLPPQTVGQEPTRDATEAVAQAKRGVFPLVTTAPHRGRATVTNQDAQTWPPIVHNLVDGESYPR
nr:hypothetical protein [uncultured bacterium]